MFDLLKLERGNLDPGAFLPVVELCSGECAFGRALVFEQRIQRRCAIPVRREIIQAYKYLKSIGFR